MRRSLRGKPERPTTRMEKRAAGAALPPKLTITLSDDASSTSTASLKKMLAGNASTKTKPSAAGGESVAAAPAASKGRNRRAQYANHAPQNRRPLVRVGSRDGATTRFSFGLDPNHKQKLAKLRKRSKSIKNDYARLTAHDRALE